MKTGRLGELYLKLCCTLMIFQGNLAFSPISQSHKKFTFHLTSSRQYALRTKSNKKWDVSNINMDKDDRGTEVKRIRFILNQLRGDFQESEMRATAAERRVATLQKSLHEITRSSVTLNETEEETRPLKDSKEEFQAVKEENMKLKDSINQLLASMDFSKRNTKKKIEIMEKERESERRKSEETRIMLEEKLDNAKQTLENTREECNQLRVDLDKTKTRLKHELQELKLAADIQIEETVKKFDSRIEDLKSAFASEKVIFSDERASLENELSALKKRSHKLEEDLKGTKREMTAKLMTTKSSYETQLEDASKELKKSMMTVETKNNTICQLESERKSLRKLYRLQFSILKQRIANRFKRRKKTKTSKSK
jgi:chromosome segregation ATPase